MYVTSLPYSPPHPHEENYSDTVDLSTNSRNMQWYQLLQTRLDQHRRMVGTFQQIICKTYRLESALKGK